TNTARDAVSQALASQRLKIPKSLPTYPEAAVLRLNKVCASGPPEMLEAAGRQIQDFLRNAVAVQGPRALENPRSSAKYHEAGHAVVHAFFGEHVRRCRI